MSHIELDQAKPCDLKAVDSFYESNLESIVKLDSPSLSQRTASSSSSIVRGINSRENRSGTSTESDSDQDEFELDSVPTTRDNFQQHLTSSPANNLLSNDGNNVIMVNHADNNVAHSSGPRINSVAIQHSSDIQFGDKTFYNGPVTIKQFLLDDRNKKWVCRSNDEISQLENGMVNKGFDGSQVVANGLQPQSDTKTESSNNNNLFKKRNFTLSRKNALLTFSTAICAFIAIVLLSIYLFFGQQRLQKHQQPSLLGDGDDSRSNIAINSTIGSDLLLGKVLRLHARDDWLAQPPNNELTNLILPAKRVIITHTATQSCEFTAECTLRVRLIQTYHMESKNWDDIGYNFLVGGDGEVYEGRGWDKQGAHTKGYNTGSIGIAYIGTFNKIEPNKKQLLAGQLLMEEGVKLGKLIPDYKIYAHRQLIASESPGAAFYEIIKKWDHWTNDPPEVFQ